jgi:3-oxoacyl-[acyl-carrier protein] reductase
MTMLAGKIVLVTGASKGIGAGIAKQLAARGATVAVNYASSREGADRVVNEIKANGGSAAAFQGDISHHAAVERIFAEVNAAFGRIGILVNNAGVFRLGSLETVTEQEFHDHFNINVLGLLLTTQKAAAQFGDQGGSIINIGSIISQISRPGTVLYAASKGAMDAVTKVLALELGPRKIRVNSVLPGPTETEGAGVARSKGDMDAEFVRAIISRTALGRMGTPEDIALAVAFLASDDARWITGQLISVSGGRH